jgi:hypothetical protein
MKQQSTEPSKRDLLAKLLLQQKNWHTIVLWENLLQTSTVSIADDFFEREG